MYNKIVATLDSIAETLQQDGRSKEALMLDLVSDSLEEKVADSKDDLHRKLYHLQEQLGAEPPAAIGTQPNPSYLEYFRRKKEIEDIKKKIETLKTASHADELAAALKKHKNILRQFEGDLKDYPEEQKNNAQALINALDRCDFAFSIRGLRGTPQGKHFEHLYTSPY